MTTTTTDPGRDGLLAAAADVVARSEISTLVHRLGACLDEGRFDDLRSLFVDDAVARTPGGIAEGIDAVVAQAARNHRPDDGIQHLISGVLVDLNGDRATVRANLVVTFARRSPVTDVPAGLGPEAPTAQGQVYRFAARRTAAAWRLAQVETDLVWFSHAPVAPAPRPAA